MSAIELEILQNFCECIPLGVCLVDLKGRITYWNSSAESITGYLGHEVLGRAYRGDLLVHNAGKSPVIETQCPVNEVLREGRPVQADLFLRHKLGHRVPVHVYAFPLRNAMGEVAGVGEVLDPGETLQENPAWVGHSEREFELATGLAATEESRDRLKALLHSRSASTRESNAPIAALSTVADSLPGLGIVAAVLGVVVTMGALGGPPEEIGHKVAAALVGTFLGILLC